MHASCAPPVPLSWNPATWRIIPSEIWNDSAHAWAQGMFNDEAFSKMKKGARIVNVARGGVIDEAALARALDNGQVAQVPMLSTLCESYAFAVTPCQHSPIFPASLAKAPRVMSILKIGPQPTAEYCLCKKAYPFARAQASA